MGSLVRGGLCRRQGAEAELGGLQRSQFTAGDVVELDESFFGLDSQLGRHLLGIGQLGLTDGAVGDQFFEPVGGHRGVSAADVKVELMGQAHTNGARTFSIGIMGRYREGVKFAV